jgi:hypothetical protein
MPWRLSLRALVHGGLIFQRRMTTQGEVTVLSHRFIVDATWPHRLVRAEVDVDEEIIHFSAQRRREPMAQPRLRTLPIRCRTDGFGSERKVLTLVMLQPQKCTAGYNTWPLMNKPPHTFNPQQSS